MTGTKHTGEGLDARRRKLLFRSWHRGMREMDLILGNYADVSISSLTPAEIEQYEALLEVADTELLPVLTGERPVPMNQNTEIINKIIASRQSIQY